MYVLTPQQAQNIVDRMMKDIPYNINIMDQSGKIIGSGNPKRIGTLHHGAVAAIKQRKIVEIEKDEEFVKKGINLPIELNGIIVGVVGISGEVNETSRFGKLVKSTVVLLIEQSMALEKENLERNQKQDFFHSILEPETHYTKELAELALTYGIQLNKPSQIIYIEFSNSTDESIIKQFPTFQVAKNTLCLIIQEPNKIEQIVEHLKEQFKDASISISKRNGRISDGYQQCRSAIRVLKGLYSGKKNVISYNECEFVANVSEGLKHDPQVELLKEILANNEELIITLKAYISCNLNTNETAKQLIIHRNTLSYRLNRIHQLTGKDPKNILDLVELLFTLINPIK